MSTLQSLHAALVEELSNTQDFSQAIWQEADGSSGYILSPDGRMAQCGDYQFGFKHIDEFLTHPNQKEAAGELSRILGSLEGLDEENKEIASTEYWSWCYGDSFAKAIPDYEKGKISFEDMFDLATSFSRIAGPTQTETHLIKLSNDLIVQTLDHSSGKWEWKDVLVAKAGEELRGNSATTTFVNTFLGAVNLTPQEVTSVTALPRPPHCHR